MQKISVILQKNEQVCSIKGWCRCRRRKKVWYSKQVLAVLRDAAEVGAEKKVIASASVQKRRRLLVYRCRNQVDSEYYSLSRRLWYSGSQQVCSITGWCTHVGAPSRNCRVHSQMCRAPLWIRRALLQICSLRILLRTKCLCYFLAFLGREDQTQA